MHLSPRANPQVREAYHLVEGPLGWQQQGRVRCTGEQQKGALVATFEQAVSESDVIFIVGTGLSAATSANAPTATWVGLVRSGIFRARELDGELGDDWSKLVEELIGYGVRTGSAETIIKAAGMVADALKKIGIVAFNNWLRDDVGALDVKSRDAASALLSYPFPVLTTNYDTLLEQVGDRESRDWTDSRGFHDVVTRASRAIGHIHGVWNHPESVVLTESDYAALNAHESTRALEKAMATLKSIVYVGFGGGLSDPNFATLFAWHRSTFPESSVSHFRLCLSDEEDALRKEHANDHVIPVVYGDSYADLGPFLARNAPSSAGLITNEVGLARDVVQEARDMLRDSMTHESVLVDASAGDLVREDLVIPPVFLPVPHATFVRERIRRGQNTEVERLDGHEEVKSHDFFVVVGDDGSGLTTAIKWLATQSSELLGSAAPLFIRFADCRHRPDPFGSALTKAALSCGLVSDKSSPLPPHIVVLDDFKAAVPRLSDTVLAQIVAAPSIVKIIGCHQGEEDELTSKLSALGVSPRVLFLGRMRRSDIGALAEKLSPGQGAQLAENALRVLDAEGLRRTPLTVSLLLYLAYRGSSHETRNQASMLDAYTTLLLGIGDPHQNETGLTETDLEAILGNFAESLIWDEKPSVSQSEAVRIVAEVINKYGWQANSAAVLEFFVKRRLLRRHGESVEFARYAYFTLFAAKRALVDADFRKLIVGDLFYYQPVAVKLAALSRADEDLLKRLRTLIDDELADTVSPGSPYEPTPLITVDELPPPDDSPSSDVARDADEPDDLELPESDSVGSFGLVKSDMSTIARLHRTLTLISSILRDLDQVEDLVLKRELLVGTLELWGRFITALSTDSSLADLRSAIMRHFESTGDGEDEKASDFIEFLSRSIPAGTAISGIEMALVSPKLASVLDSALDGGELSHTNERLTATLFFLFLLRSKGWAEKAKALVDQAESTWVLTHFFQALCQDAYAQGVAPEGAVLELCKSLFLKQQTFTTPDIRSAHLDRYTRSLRTDRARNRQSPAAGRRDL